MYLGGNGFYWRVAVNPALPGAVEIRRGEGGIRAWAAEPGEYYNAFDGGYGGLWRNSGRAPQRLAGVGFISQGDFHGTGYRRLPASRDPRAAWIFEGIEEEVIGGFGLSGGGAAGFELDWLDHSLGSPPHALVLARSEAHDDTFVLVPEEILTHHATRPGGAPHELIRSEMVYFETPEGGAVVFGGLDLLLREPAPQRLRQQRLAPGRQRPAAASAARGAPRPERAGPVASGRGAGAPGASGTRRRIRLRAPGVLRPHADSGSAPRSFSAPRRRPARTATVSMRSPPRAGSRASRGLDREILPIAPLRPGARIAAHPRVAQALQHQVAVRGAVVGLAVRDHLLVRGDPARFQHLAQLRLGPQPPLAGPRPWCRSSGG